MRLTAVPPLFSAARKDAGAKGGSQIHNVEGLLGKGRPQVHGSAGT